MSVVKHTLWELLTKKDFNFFFSSRYNWYISLAIVTLEGGWNLGHTTLQKCLNLSSQSFYQEFKWFLKEYENYQKEKIVQNYKKNSKIH